MNKLVEIRSRMMGFLASSRASLEVDNYVLIISKQREIVRLVAEASNNGNMGTNYDKQIQHKQSELDQLVSLKNKGKAGFSSDLVKLKELRRLLLG